MNMERRQKILACVDRSSFAYYVADYAAWLAKESSSDLEFLHILERKKFMSSMDDFSGAIGLDAQNNLLSELSQKDAEQARKKREEGRVFLNELKERAESAGAIHVDMKQRIGSLEENLVEVQNDADLIVMGRRGESASLSGREIGRNVESMVRALKKPILTVTEPFKKPERVLLAYDGGYLSRKGIEILTSHALFAKMELHVVLSGRERGDDGEKKLNRAKEQLEKGGIHGNYHVLPGDPELVLAKAVSDWNVDLLLMGAYAHSAWRSFLIGSRTNDLLRSARVPALLIR